MQNRLAVVRTVTSEDRRLFMELIEGLWEKASTMVCDSPLDSCGAEWGELAEGAAAVLAEMVAPNSDDYLLSGDARQDHLLSGDISEERWWERAAWAGFRVVVCESDVHPIGRRGVAALETSFLFSMLSGFTGNGEGDPVVFDWQDGTPAASGSLPGGAKGVLAASRRGGESGGLGLIVGMVRRQRNSCRPEILIEAVLPTTADRVLAVRLEA